MKTIALADVAEINPRGERVRPGDDVSFVGMAELDPVSAAARPLKTVPYSDVSKGYTVFRDRDLLVAKITPCFENGKVGQALLDHPIGVGSTEFHVVRPGAEMDSRFLLRYLQRPHFRAAGTLRMTGSGGQRRVPANYLAQLDVPLLPLDEQRRIAAILDHADTLRAKRRQVLTHLDTLTQSIFFEMFGDAARELRPLSDFVKFYSGGTPSKQEPKNWVGSVPWFSAKDLKRSDLFDSQDHISEQVPVRTSLRLLPAGTIALVVRGMILAHTFPVSVLRVPATINQDLKALIPKVPVSVDFLATALRAKEEWTLARISTAAHGTKKLESTVLESIPIPVAGGAESATFSRRVAVFNSERDAVQQSLAAHDRLFASLQSRAFRGDL